MPWRLIQDSLAKAEAGSVRGAFAALLAQLGLDRLVARTPAQRQSAFTIAIIALAAKLAKSDGVALRIEAEAFERLYHVPHEELPNVQRVFDLAKQDVAGFEAYAGQMAALMADEPELKRDVLEGLFHIASADGILHEAEEHYLKRVADLFGCGPADYRRIRALFARDEADPYVILGVDHGASPEEIRARYRELAREYHPDTLMGHGVPADFIDQATRKLAAINAAYDVIRKERGF